MKFLDGEHPDRLNDTTYYGDCCFCGGEIIGFVCVDDDLGVCHPDCPKDNAVPEYNCHWCDTPTWNGAGHWQEEMGYDHPQGEDRICTPCFRKWEGEQTNA